jgi:hypothetical protein
MNKKPTSFADKMSRNIKHQKDNATGNKFGYLNLPDGVSLLKLKEGIKEATLDFLLYPVTDPKHPDRDPEFDVAMPDTLWYRRPILVHQNVGTKKEKCLCLKSIGKKCPICDYQEKRRKEKADKEEIKELYPKPRSLYAVIPIDMDGVEEKIHIWDMSDHLFQKTLNEECEIDESLKAFADLENGKTLTLKIRWKSMDDKNSFPDIRSIDFEDRDPYSEKTLKKVPHLDEILKVLSYDELEKKFFELEDEEDGGSLKEEKEVEEDDRPRRRRTEEDEDEKPARKRKSEEDEEEEKPVRRSRKEETEEEDEKPVRKRREEPEEEDEKPARKSKEEEQAPKLTRSSKPAKEESTGSRKCPHGHKFGVDADTKDDCERCDIWSKCLDEKEGK